VIEDEGERPPKSITLVLELRSMSDHEVLYLGDVDLGICHFWPGFTTQRLVVIGERRTHILTSHPELAGHEESIVRTLLDPEEVHRNKVDERIAILYRELPAGLWMRLPVWISNRDDRDNSLLSARFTKLKEVEHGRAAGRLVWRKG
jgi:hypothetical protein